MNALPKDPVPPVIRMLEPLSSDTVSWPSRLSTSAGPDPLLTTGLTIPWADSVPSDPRRGGTGLSQIGTSPRTLLVRCDVGPAYGVGHLMRCVALAEEYAARGFEVVFSAEVDSVPFALDQVGSRGFRWVEPAGLGGRPGRAGQGSGRRGDRLLRPAP